MLESVLLLEVGSEALVELSADEKTAILARYTDSQCAVAGMKVFGLLMKKYQPNYRMGKMYEDLGQKYEAYRRIYNDYARSVNAGRSSSEDESLPRYDIEKTKFVKFSMEPTNEP